MLKYTLLNSAHITIPYLKPLFTFGLDFEHK